MRGIYIVIYSIASGNGLVNITWGQSMGSRQSIELWFRYLAIPDKSLTILKSKTIAKGSAPISRQECNIKISIRESSKTRRISLFIFRLLWWSWSRMLWLSSCTALYGDTMWATANWNQCNAISWLLLRYYLHPLWRLLWWSFWSLRRHLSF